MNKWALTAVVSLVLCGCIGVPPRQPAPSLPAAAPLGAAGSADGLWPQAQWWKHYADPDLDRLIALALQSSPTLATAHARLDTARQSVRIAGSTSGAHIEAVGDGSRQRLSDNGLFPPNLLGFHWYDQFDLGLQASYTFDWWGKQKDAVDAAIDEARAAQADRSAAALMLASSVAEAYYGWQADQGRLALAREREAAMLRERQIAVARIHADVDAADQIHRVESNLAAARGQIAVLEGSARLRVVTLAALAGLPPDQLPALTPKPLPPIAQGVPDNVKLDLISRRADLTASRWRVEAADKNREAARAEFYPDFSISALVGLQSRDFGRLLRYDSRAPDVAAAVHLPIFDAGRLKARYGAAQAGIASAVASYEETLVDAARDVATQATQRAQVGAERSQRLVQVDAAEQLRASAAARVRQGLDDSRAELAATENLIEQRDALLLLDAAAVTSDIGLQRALGGGYEINEKLE